MGVLGGPVNKVLPDLPGTKIQLTVGSLMPCTTNSAGWSPLGKISDQNGADGQCGIINVPSDLVLEACWINLGIYKSYWWTPSIIFTTPVNCKSIYSLSARFQNHELNRSS